MSAIIAPTNSGEGDPTILDRLLATRKLSRIGVLGHVASANLRQRTFADGSGAFGTFTAAHDPRILQFAVNVVF